MNRARAIQHRKLQVEQLEERRVCAAFQTGSYSVYRVGDGSATLTSAATAVFLDEYSPTGELLQSIPLPTANDGLNRKLVGSGAFGFTEGLMTRSTDGKYLVMTGYDAPLGTLRVRTTDSAVNNRVIGRVDGDGVIDTTTALTDSPAVEFSSVASTNGTDFWYSGLGGGLRFTTLGGTTGNQVYNGGSTAPEIFDGQLYISTNSLYIASVGTGLPTSAGQNLTALPGLTAAGAGRPYQYYMADLTEAVAGVDTLYFADGGEGSVAPGGVWKFSLVNGIWKDNGVTIGYGANQVASFARGLTGFTAGSSVTLVGTTPTNLFTMVDTTGYNGEWTPPSSPLTTLVTSAGTNKLFRGVALSPIAKTVELVVNSVAFASSSLSVRFAKALEVAKLNLVDSNNVNGESDLTLVGNTVGPVQGSIVLDTDGKGLTFIKSGGPLVADTYSLTLRSAVDAFVDTSGNLLDGNADGTGGDNYVRTFSVNAIPTSTVMLSAPDFERGAGQAVNLPANTTNGVPITISTGMNIKAASFNLNYDPALLTITGGTSSIAGATVTVDTASAGVARVTVTSAAQFSAIAGALTLVNLIATVPTTAPIGRKFLLRISNVSLTAADASTLASAIDEGLQIAAYKGDVNNSNSITTGDVTGLLRTLSGSLSTTGFPNFKLADPVIIGDMNDSSSLSTGDATGLLRFISGAAGGFPAIPALPTGLTPVTGADPQIFIPRNLTVTPGNSVIVPININVTESSGVSVAGIDVSFSYDVTRFTIGAISLGSALAGFTFSSSNNLTTPGSARLVYATQLGPRLASGFVGTLLNVTLIAKADAAPGVSAVNLIGAGASDNDTNDLTIAPAVTLGEDVSDGLINIPAVRGQVTNEAILVFEVPLVHMANAVFATTLFSPNTVPRLASASSENPRGSSAADGLFGANAIAHACGSVIADATADHETSVIGLLTEAIRKQRSNRARIFMQSFLPIT